MGGIGITHRRGGRKVYVEFYNDGRGHALLSERGDPPCMTTRPVVLTAEGLDAFIRDARNFVDG